MEDENQETLKWRREKLKGFKASDKYKSRQRKFKVWIKWVNTTHENGKNTETLLFK